MIDCRIDAHIALLTLNNPAANTFTADSLLQLERTIGELNRNTQVYAVVITGQGEKFVARGEARQSALTLPERAATLSPRAVSFSKQLIHQARDGTPRSAALALERERFIDLFDGADQREGVKAFLEKRKPAWKNA
jgi:enoyl-CoA hydratase/carnithine racemase